jgi:hypothetical protein
MENCSELGLLGLARRDRSLAQIDMGRAEGTYCNISLKHNKRSLRPTKISRMPIRFVVLVQ